MSETPSPPPPSFLPRLLGRLGVLSDLRRRWRADYEAALNKSGARVEARFAKLETRLGKLEPRLANLEAGVAAGDLASRVDAVEHETACLRDLLTFDREHRERRHDPVVLTTSHVAPHAAAAIARAALCDDPMPHVVVHDLLPPDTYAALVDAIPPQLCFSRRDAEKMNFKLAQADLFPEWTDTGIGFVERTLIPEILVPSLVAKFQDAIAATYAARYGPAQGAQVAALPHYASAGRLMLRRPGYHLDPHLDPRRVIVTCLLYLARPGDSEAFGTTFHRIEGAPEATQRGTYYPEHDGYRCTLVKAAAFTPNTAVAFLNAGGAHGADIPASAPKRTERYAYQFYVSPDGDALAEIAGDRAAEHDH